MKKYKGNTKKYEGITLPIYEPWDLKKFRARPVRRGGGGSQNTSLGRVGEDGICGNMKEYPTTPTIYSLNL